MGEQGHDVVGTDDSQDRQDVLGIPPADPVLEAWMGPGRWTIPRGSVVPVSQPECHRHCGPVRQPRADLYEARVQVTRPPGPTENPSR